MIKNKRVMLIPAFVIIASILLTACAPQTVSNNIEVTRIVAGTPQVQVVTATPAPAAAPQTKDTIVIGAWQQPRGFLTYANSQSIGVEVELVYRPRFIQRVNFGFKPNPALVDGDLANLEKKQGAELKEVTVKKGEPIFDVKQGSVVKAEADTKAQQLVVTGKIKKGLKWSDGQPLTAADFVLAWTKNCEKDSLAIDVTYCPKGSVDGAGGVIVSYEAKDDVTLVSTFVPGSMDALYFLAPFGTPNSYGLLPSHIFKDMKAADIAKDERALGSEKVVPLGYGAYKMTEWKKNDHITFEVNPTWSGEKPKTPKIIYRFYADSTSLASAVIAGEIDATSGITGLAVDQAPYMSSVAKRGVVNYTVDKNAASFEMLYFNFNDPKDLTKPHPVLSDFAVRKAIVLSVDRKQMVDTIYYGDSAVVGQPHLPQMVSYDKAAGEVSEKPDPEAAKKILEDAGWKVDAKDGVRVKNGVRASLTLLTTSGNAPRQQATQITQANLKAIGIEVKLDYKPSAVTFSQDGLYGRTFDMIQYANTFSVVDPGTWWYGVASCDQIPTKANGLSGANFAGWCDKDASNAVADANFNTLDPAKRKADWTIALKKYFENGYPVLPLYTRPNYLAIVPGLKGAALDGTEYFTWNIEAWTLTGGK